MKVKVYRTAADEADDEMTALLGHEGRLYKADILETHGVEVCRIDATEEEFAALLFEKAYIRPAFTVDDSLVTIPTFFVKLDGQHKALKNKYGTWVNQRSRESDYNVPKPLNFNGFYLLERPAQNNELTIIHKAQLLELQGDQAAFVSKMMDLEYQPLQVLAPQRRRVFAHAVWRVLLLLKDMPTITLSDDFKLGAMLFNMDQILESWKGTMHQDTPPKCWIAHTQKKVPQVHAIIRLLLMQQLGFDIVIESQRGYASIENYLPDAYYSRYLGNTAVPTQGKSQVAKWVGGIGFLAAIGAALLLIF